MVSRRSSNKRRRLRDLDQSNVGNEAANESALDAYLHHLRAASSVEPDQDGSECLTLPFWSLPATKNGVVNSDSNPAPWCRIYVRRNGRDWVISDGGLNISVVLECNPDFDPHGDDFEQFLAGQSLSLGPSNSLRISSDSGFDLGKGIATMVGAIGTLDGMVTESVWATFGQPSDGERSVFDLNGDAMRFAGSVSSGDQSWISESFILSRGALAIHFEHNGQGGGKVELARDDPGIFDDPTTLFDLGEEGTGLGLWCVTEGGWRDPHPGISYHLEVSGRGRFECLFLQPKLGQAGVGFPYGANGTGGATIAGPFRVGSRPILTNLRHDGGGRFFVELISLDGTDECEVLNTDGQVHLDEHPINAKPGKEYLLYAGAGGYWELELSEGY